MKKEDARTFERHEKARSPDRRVVDDATFRRSRKARSPAERDDATFVFLGRSGSGKETQLKLLAANYKPHLIISTGDLFRALTKSRSPFGKRVREMLEIGELPPAWLASFLWLSELNKKLKEGRHLFTTGALRRVEEARLLDEVMEFLGRKKPIAIYLTVSEEEATRRLLVRGREDDTSEAIKERLRWFKEDVLPVVEYFRGEKRLAEVDGEPPAEEIHSNILKALKEREIGQEGKEN